MLNDKDFGNFFRGLSLNWVNDSEDLVHVSILAYDLCSSFLSSPVEGWFCLIISYDLLYHSCYLLHCLLLPLENLLLMLACLLCLGHFCPFVVVGVRRLCATTGFIPPCNPCCAGNLTDDSLGLTELSRTILFMVCSDTSPAQLSFSTWNAVRSHDSTSQSISPLGARKFKNVKTLIPTSI